MSFPIKPIEQAVSSLRSELYAPNKADSFADYGQNFGTGVEVDVGLWLDGKLKSAVVLGDRISGCGGGVIKEFAIELGARIIDDIKNKTDGYRQGYLRGVAMGRGLCSNAVRQRRYFPTESFVGTIWDQYPAIDDSTRRSLKEAWDGGASAILPKENVGEHGVVDVVGMQGDVFGSRASGLIENAYVVVCKSNPLQEKILLHEIDALDPSMPIVFVGDAVELKKFGVFSKKNRWRRDIYLIDSGTDELQTLIRPLPQQTTKGDGAHAFNSNVVVNDRGAYLFDYPVVAMPLKANGYRMPLSADDGRWAMIEPIHRRIQSVQAHGYIDARAMDGVVTAVRPTLDGLDGAEAAGAKACVDVFSKANWIGADRYAPFHMVDRSLHQIPDAFIQCAMSEAPAAARSSAVSFDINGRIPAAPAGESDRPDAADTVERRLDVILASEPSHIDASPIAVGSRFLLTVVIRLLTSPGANAKSVAVKFLPDVPVVFKVDAGGLRLLSRNNYEVRIPPDEDSLPATFILEMVAAHDCWLTLSVYQDGKFLRQINFSGSDFAGQAREYPLVPGTDIDLVLHVRDDFKVEGDSPPSVCNLSGCDLGPLLPISTGLSDELREKLRNLQSPGAELEAIDTELQVIGSRLADAVPMQLMHRLREGKVKAIFLRHALAFDFPFELVLVEKENKKGNKDDYFFVGDRIAVCRWYLGIEAAPSQDRKIIDHAAVLAGDTAFAASDYELISRNCSAQSFDAADLVYRDVFKTKTYNLLHFIGHCDGTNAADPALVLKNGRIALERIYRAPAEKEFANARPIVVLNGCATANPYLGLLGKESFAYRFLLANASMFVGTLWPVHEEVAHEFSQVFYAKIASGIRLGEALLETKQAIVDSTEDRQGKPLSDWQRVLRRISARSYSAFGHPNFSAGFSANP